MISHHCTPVPSHLELHSCSGDHLPAGVPEFPGFVSCSSGWITAVKFGVGNVAWWTCTWPGEAEEWGVFEEMLPRMGEAGLNPLNDLKWQGNAAWKLYFLPPIFSHLLEAKDKVEDKSAGRKQKNRAWKMLFPLYERKILNLRVSEGGEMLDPLCELLVLALQLMVNLSWNTFLRAGSSRSKIIALT